MTRQEIREKQAEMRRVYPDVIPAIRTHCKNGHALTPDNLIKHQLEKYKIRACKKCDSISAKKRYMRMVREKKEKMLNGN